LFAIQDTLAAMQFLASNADDDNNDDDLGEEGERPSSEPSSESAMLEAKGSDDDSDVDSDDDDEEDDVNDNNEDDDYRGQAEQQTSFETSDKAPPSCFPSSLGRYPSRNRPNARTRQRGAGGAGGLNALASTSVGALIEHVLYDDDVSDNGLSLRQHPENVNGEEAEAAAVAAAAAAAAPTNQDRVEFGPHLPIAAASANTTRSIGGIWRPQQTKRRAQSSVTSDMNDIAGALNEAFSLD
jgi:hypothetical protein